MKIKSIFIFLLLVAMVVCCLCIYAGATDSIGYCGNSVMYSFDSAEKTVYISGEGEMEDFSDFNESPFLNICIEKVIIEDGISSIGDYAFYGCEFLSEISLPDSITSIGSSAFEYCQRLDEILLPENLDKIGNNAFSGCEAIEKIVFPSGVKHLPDYSFFGCTNLKDVVFKGEINSIDNYAFYNCISLETVHIFSDSFSWSDISVGKNNTKITDATLHTGSSLTEMEDIPADCSTQGRAAGLYCSECDKYISGGATSPVLSHNLGEWSPDGNGTHTRVCLNKHSCTYFETAECSYGEWIVTKEPTCSAYGEKTQKCTVCGHNLTEQIGKTSHSYSSVETAPTCTDEGYTTYTCGCGDTYTGDIVGPLGHDEVMHEGKAPTCTEFGWHAYVTCSRCDYKSYEEIASVGHSYTYEVTKAATCTTKGEIVYSCTCGDSYTETLDNVEHVYSKFYTTDKKSTCSAEGSKSKHCIYSGCTAKADVTSVPKSDHSYTNPCDTICNDCNAERTTRHAYSDACDKECNICKATRSITHSYKTTTSKATLKKNGKQVTRCSVCGDVKSSKTIYCPKSIKLSASTYTCNGKTKTPSVVVKDSKGNILNKDTDYTVKYENGRKNPGKYTVTVTFKGKYTGTKKLTLTIKPKAPSITDIYSKTKGKAVIKWSNVSGESGYQLYFSTSKDGSYKKVDSYGANKTAGSKTKLKSGKRYYFKVRAYKKTSNGTVYSSWSKIYSVKIK